MPTPNIPAVVVEPIHIIQIPAPQFERLVLDARLGRAAKERAYATLRGPRQHFNIPNNIIGRVWLWLFRRWVNRASYTIDVKGRSPKSPALRCSHGVPRRHAKRLGVYLNPKHRKTRRTH